MKKYEVNHSNLYMQIDGKLQRAQRGSQLTLSDEQALAMGTKIRPVGEQIEIKTAKKTSSGDKSSGKS